MLNFVFALAFVAAAPPQDASNRELQDLNGDWRLVSVEVDGKKMPAQKTNEFSLTFKDGKFTSYRGGEKRTGTYKINVNTSPKTMDIVPGDGADKGKKWSLIYKLEGNTLRICGSDIDQPRPTGFDTKDRTGIILMVLRHE